MPTMSAYDQVQTMSALHSTLQQASRFLRKYEQELLASGADISADVTVKLMCAERDEIAQQILQLHTEMKNTAAHRQAMFVQENVAG